jgi:cephalosporin-C deacetylase
MNRSLRLVWLAACCLPFFLLAQPRTPRVQVVVTPVETDWTYQTGDRADFQVRVLRDGQPLAGQVIAYKIGPEQMPPEMEGKLTLKDGTALIKGMKLKQPGFLRCEVTAAVGGESYRDWGTAGFNPAAIEPAVKMPEDFDAFWEAAKAELAQIPLDAKLLPLPERSSAKSDVYQLNLANVGGSRFYGILSVPKAPGKYPALLQVPGAGARPYSGDDRADQGLITLQVGIHGIPVTLDPEVYSNLMQGAISGYWINKLDDREKYYYRRVYLGCVRAIDYLFSMEEFDGETLAVTGGSQGGALSIITAGLDPRVKYLAAYYPALCDLTGYLAGRAGGWPHMFRDYDPAKQPQWTTVAPYYDVVNFARRVKAEGWYSWGFNDHVCPPTSMHAAYNVIEAPKSWTPFYETEHWTFPEQREMGTQWLLEKLGTE